jgi:hypothetical protein
MITSKTERIYTTNHSKEYQTALSQSTCEDNAIEVDIIVGAMIQVVNISQVLITAVFIFSLLVVAYLVPLTHRSLVKYLCLNVSEP